LIVDARFDDRVNRRRNVRKEIVAGKQEKEEKEKRRKVEGKIGFSLTRLKASISCSR
jgi:hypothetical protein